MHACFFPPSPLDASLPNLSPPHRIPLANLPSPSLPLLCNKHLSKPHLDLSHCARSLTAYRSLEHTQMANSASGLAVNDECKIKFLDLKARRSFRFIVFRIDEKAMEIKVERLGETSEGYDDFAASLPADECRYAVYDLDFVTNENCQKSKIFFFSWSPDTARTRSKMLYASSKDRFRREMDGIQCEIQATDPSEMSLDIVKGRAGN